MSGLYLYYQVEALRLALTPLRYNSALYLSIFKNKLNPIYATTFAQNMRAALEVTERLTHKYIKPEFNIKKVYIKDKKYLISQNVVHHKPFCNLLHFKKVDYPKWQPRLLIVAPLAGHHATLLRNTVEELLPYVDVYITDWISASQVPLKRGEFNMDDNIDYIIRFLRVLGPKTHVVAVCQPTVSTLAATAILSAENDPCIPNSVTLMGGPIDARQHPTKLNTFVTDKNIEWFENNVITVVPHNYPGFRRKVYPGFLQLTGFILLHLQTHIESYVDLYHNLTADDTEKVKKQESFYDEYLATMDLPAEFYLQTVKEVFKDFSLATGHMMSRDRKVDLSMITKPALFGIEGEKDDIAAVGQTRQALSLCKNIPKNRKAYYVQEGAGHYGIFSGSKFKKFIAPKIRDFIYTYSNPPLDDTTEKS